MDKLTGIISDLLLFAEYFSFFYVVLCRDFRKRTKKQTIGICVCILIWLSGLFIGYNELSLLLLPVSIIDIILFFIVYMLFDVKPVNAIAMICGEYLLLSIMVLPIMVSLEHISMNNDLKEMLNMIIMILFIWLSYLILDRTNNGNILELPIKMWWIIDVIMFVLVLMMSFFSYVIVDYITDTRAMTVGRILSVFGSSFISILIFVLLYYYNLIQNVRFEKELVEIQNEQQRIYFKGLLEKEEETRRFRHDIINDLLEIKNYSEKKDYLKLDNYLQDVLGEIIDISDSYYDVGNDIVNTVLNYYLKPLKNNYEIQVDGYMGNPVSIDERDICVVCANLIKNSAEAVQKVKQGSIIFSVNQGKQFISIMVRNTYDGKLTKDKNGEIITQKKDKKNHGVGINAVKRVVKKYEGKYETNIDEKMYCVKIFLKLK